MVIYVYYYCFNIAFIYLLIVTHMNFRQVNSYYRHQQPEIKLISVEDLYDSYQLLIQQTSQCCKELKLMICQQMRLNSVSDLQIQCQYDIGIENIKEVVRLINRDLIKLKSLLRMCLSKKSNDRNQDQNEQRILRICMLAKQMCLMLKQAQQHTEKDQIQFIMSNLCSMFKIFNENLFSYESSQSENQQIIDQIYKKIPKLNQQIWIKYSQSAKSINDRKNNEDLDLLQKYREQIEMMRKEYTIQNERFQEELIILARQNSVLQQTLRIKIEEIERNEAEFIIYLKKYNSYIEKQNEQIENLSRQIQLLEEQKKYKNQKDFFIFQQIGEIKQKLNKTKEISGKYPNYGFLDKTSKTTKGISSTYASNKRPVIRD